MPVSAAEGTWAFIDMRKTLLALALTCKSFTEPALDLLWRHLGRLEPLIRCLPQSLWKQNGNRLVSQALARAQEYTI
ncbi:hypothetical protein DFJ58DRAFT_664029 [Suillus subalutaceus]|uniref:uncharacterized protein n=1 Tax=Suillus subalutaceus TaxID=48586 RepID=UPI001B87F2CC|nr:uncharacterized protein DFJ58DRAFT_664029 [Suillus subalutaceus]KAG1846077.1 hypothetical protein DFJ58DRAFT_664029 [Suillus subalutaceus]